MKTNAMKTNEMELKNRSESDVVTAPEITREGPVYTPRVSCVRL